MNSHNPLIAWYCAVPQLDDALAGALAEPFAVRRMAQPGTPLEHKPALVVGVLARYDLAQHAALQAVARHHGSPLLCVAADAHAAWVGPVTPAQQDGGCLHCMELWGAHRWSAQDREAGAAQATQSWTWSGGHADVLGAQLRMAAEAIVLAPQAAGGEQGMLRFDARTLASSRHPLIAHPDCPYCSPRVDDSAQAATIRWQPRLRPQPRGYRLDNPALDAARLHRRYVDGRVGFIRRMYDDKSSGLMPQVLSAFAADRAGSQYEVGCGRTGERDGSELVSMLEAQERFCGFEPRRKRTMVHASHAQLAGDPATPAADPRSFLLHGEAQQRAPGFQFVPYSEDVAMDWVWAHSLRSDGPRLVPEQLGYYRVPRRSGAAPQKFVFEISNGCALGNGIEEAVLHGLFEVIERDAFLTTWYGRITPVELDIADVGDPTVAALAAQAANAGWTLRVFDMSMGFGVPSIMVMLVDSDDGPVKSLCLSGAHADPEKAILGAMVEALATFSTLAQRQAGQRERSAALLADGNLVQSMGDHQLLYSHPDSYARLDFLTAPQRKVPVRERFAGWYASVPPADMTAELHALAARLMTVADDILVVDQTSDELARQGLCCVKVLAPGLLPMTFGHQHRRVSATRINRALRMLGRPGNFTDADLNPYPHNFP